MSSSFSSHYKSYLTSGPFVFKAGVGGISTTADASNLVQNFPFVDGYQNILKRQNYLDGSGIVVDSSLRVGGIVALNHALADDTADLNTLATCGYVQNMEKKWAQFKAIQDVDISGHDIKGIHQLLFADSDVSMSTFRDGSRNLLQLTCDGLVLPYDNDGAAAGVDTTSDFVISHNSQSSIKFSSSGELYFTSSHHDSSLNRWITNDNSMYLDRAGYLHAVVVTPDLQTSATCVIGTVTFHIGLPSFAKSPLPPRVAIAGVIITDISQCTHDAEYPKVTAFDFPNNTLTENREFMYNTSILNACATDSIYLDATQFQNDKIGCNWNGYLEIGPKSLISLMFMKNPSMSGGGVMTDYMIIAFPLNGQEQTGGPTASDLCPTDD
jgi:hypothetical protein